MKRYIIGLCALLWIVGSVKTEAQTDNMQDIHVTDFQRVVTDLTASMNPVNDNNGIACAVIKFDVRDTTFVIEPNLGYMKRESKVGEIRLWVPAGTRRLTIRHNGMFPLRDYIIPEAIDSKATYHATLWTRINTPTVETSNDIAEKKDSRSDSGSSHIPPTPVIEDSKGELLHTSFSIGAGFLILPKPGASLMVGLNVNHHIIEAGGAIAFSKTDSLHYYENSTWLGSYQYRLMKAFVRYGYEFRTKGNGKMTFAYTPMAGIQSALSSGAGRFNEGSEMGKKQSFKDGMALSVSAAVRLALCVGDNFTWYVKPEFNIAAYKSDSYKLMIKGNDAFKKWAEGFGLETGVVVTF